MCASAQSGHTAFIYTNLLHTRTVLDFANIGEHV
jgi:hypothetical protein